MRARAVLAAGTTLLWVLVIGVLALGLGTVWLLGWRLQVVETGSMSPEVPTGSLALTAPANPRSIEVGDVIAFDDPLGAERTILHRVVEVRTGEHHQPRFVTQGDANLEHDAAEVRAGLVQGRMLGSVPRLGTATRVLHELPTPTRWLILAGLPLGVALIPRGSRTAATAPPTLRSRAQGDLVRPERRHPRRVPPTVRSRDVTRRAVASGVALVVLADQINRSSHRHLIRR